MNKEKIKTVKGLVKQLRSIRDRMNQDIENMNFEEEKAYLRKMRLGKDSSLQAT
ncbi:MAG: hypothetical protein KAK04_14100 [Cyclobacteriaceae bacterium]|nr:hypothetical protein [Cyclobacteriaceae bacterium]